MQIIVFIFLIFRIILSDSYTATINLGTGEISKIYPQFVDINFASIYFYCYPYKQINKTVSECVPSETICHAPKVVGLLMFCYCMMSIGIIFLLDRDIQKFLFEIETL